MAKESKPDVHFVAIYGDGSRHGFTIDPFTLRNGDHVARTVAVEQQRGRLLPPGKIVRIERGY
jgi:hypothetical protein